MSHPCCDSVGSTQENQLLSIHRCPRILPGPCACLLHSTGASRHCGLNNRMNCHTIGRGLSDPENLSEMSNQQAIYTNAIRVYYIIYNIPKICLKNSLFPSNIFWWLIQPNLDSFCLHNTILQPMKKLPDWTAR